MAHDVFISHSSINKQVADAICHALEENGVRCWVAPRDIPPGSNYGAEIIKGIRECSIFLLVFSTESNTSAAVHKEVERAVLGYNKIIIPFRIEDIPMCDSLEFFLTDVQWINALVDYSTHWLDVYPDTAIFDELIAAVKKTMGMCEEEKSLTSASYSANPSASDIANSDISQYLRNFDKTEPSNQHGDKNTRIETAYLHCTSPIDETEKQRVRIENTPFTIGRRFPGGLSASRLYIARKYISSQHAEITREDGTYYIADVGTDGKGSTGGTYVNESKLEPNVKMPLKDGDTIRLYEMEYKFIMD